MRCARPSRPSDASCVRVGLLQLLSARALLQGYLCTALERWYLAKHSRSKQKARKNSVLVAASLINNTAALMPRVGQQLLLPACVFIALGCTTCDAVGLGKGALGQAEQVSLYRAASFVVPPQLVTHTVARTVGFFGLLAHSMYSLIILALRRTRVFKSTNI
jgi:hypothetical protein